MIMKVIMQLLLQMKNTTTMGIKRLRTLAIEIFKAINNVSPNFIKKHIYP